jgi:CRP/FNR family transcriptional regulator, cyclic AMP receptor protein
MISSSDIAYGLGFIGAALMLASYMMKSMLPLRLAALAACIFFFAYGWLTWALPSLVLYGLLIPINLKKARQVHQLVKSIEKAKADTPISEWLLPHMSRREAKAGELLWSKGDAAKEMVYVDSGSVRLLEHDDTLGAGTLLGEIGLFADDHRRTLSVRCETDCRLYTMSAETMAALYYQNPKLGFHVMRLVVQRLMHDAERARAGAASAARPVTTPSEPPLQA